MKIIDLDERNKPDYLLCLEDWSSQIKEAGNHKSLWYEKMKEKGLRVKLAVDDNGTAGGMIQYLPIENSFASGEDLFLIYCIWVHGYKEGRGNFQKKGLGTALLETAEDDARSSGVKGIAAWGISLPFWMKASWFKKHGFKKADKDGMALLLWKPFVENALPPRWIKQKQKPERVPGKVSVTAFVNGWCPAQNLVCERAKRAAGEFGDEVLFTEINTLERENQVKWGITDALFIDEKQVRTGPPPTYQSIKKKIGRKVKKLR